LFKEAGAALQLPRKRAIGVGFPVELMGGLAHD
jgi:hypothetical protein